MSDWNAELCLCFFKQKTAYELRISDWSSDVCSSDLQEQLDWIAQRVALLQSRVREACEMRIENLAKAAQAASLIPISSSNCRPSSQDFPSIGHNVSLPQASVIHSIFPSIWARSCLSWRIILTIAAPSTARAR